MKIQYCSDLHLEFAQNALFLHKNSIKPVADTLILAEDITLWGQKHFKHWFFDFPKLPLKKPNWQPINLAMFKWPNTSNTGTVPVLIWASKG